MSAPLCGLCELRGESFLRGTERSWQLVAQRGRAAIKIGSPCPPCLPGFNTKDTEPLSDLCVKSFPATEDTEKNLCGARRSSSLVAQGAGTRRSRC